MRRLLTVGVLAGLLAHLGALAGLLDAVLPRAGWGALARTALPWLRVVGIPVAALASLALGWLAVRGRPPRAAPGVLAVLVAALAAGSGTYGCSKQARVTPRPITTTTTPTGVAVFDHGAFDRVLGGFVDAAGMVDYVGLKRERQLLDEYVGQLATASPRSRPELFPTADDRMAYWINAYNALMMRAVVDAYPIGSVTDIMVAHGVFSRLSFPVGGAAMSLDDIEKGILLKEFDDPRVHFALTCASMSCPRIDRTAFVGAGLGERLDAEGRDFLRSRDGVRIDAAAGRVELSRYFEWYADDFGADHLAFVRRYLDESQRAALAGLAQPSLGHFDYDWRLNDQHAAWSASRAAP